MKFKTIEVADLNKLKVRRRGMCFNFSKSSVTNMEGVHTDLITIFTEAIKNSPIDFGVPKDGGLRSQGEQNLIFQSGKSKCDGFENKSNHQTGNALDFYAYVNKKASWDKVHLSIIAGVIMATAKRLLKEGKISIEIKWGGEFGSDSFHGYDYPHIEVVV